MYINKTFSNFLIYCSIFFTLLSFIIPNILLFGINDFFIVNWKWYMIFIQFFVWSFLHWSFMHLLFNSIFIYYFWNILELLIWKKKMIYFFIFTVFFIGTMLLINIKWNTIWISWFAMALLSYYTLELKSRKNPEYKWWITALILNIAIWLVPWISLLWHLYWAIAWVIFYFLNKELFRKKMVWVVDV